MIYMEYNDFVAAVREKLHAAITNPDAHRWGTEFRIGDPDKGHYLIADMSGYVTCLCGVKTQHAVRHVATPLTNLQAAVEALSAK